MDNAETLVALLRSRLAACEAAPEPGGDTSTDHLAWMCRTALDKVGTHPSDKLWRWAGYVQGCLASKGLVSDCPGCPLEGDAGSALLVDAHRRLFERYLGKCEARPDAGAGTAGTSLAELCRSGLEGLGHRPIDSVSFALGFVQGVLVYAGVLEVKEERDHSRPLFHAAYGETGEVPATLERP